LLESQSLHRELGDQGGVGFCLNVLGVIASSLQEYQQARDLLVQSWEIFCDIDHQWGVAIVSINLGSLFKTQKDYQAAEKLLTEGLMRCQRMNHRWAMATCFTHLGAILRLKGETNPAYASYLDALRLQKEIGDRRGMLQVLVGIAAILDKLGQVELAVEVLAFFQNDSAESINLHEQAQRKLAELAVQLPDEIFHQAQKKGLDQNIESMVEGILLSTREKHSKSTFE